jgi:hypothetical protein
MLDEVEVETTSIKWNSTNFAFTAFYEVRVRRSPGEICR